MSIDLRHLSALLAIDQHGSFSRAADALNMSQPALSAAIATLERRLGARVILRTSKGATLNELGNALKRHAENVQATLRQAEEEAQLHKAGVTGRLLLGGTPISLTIIAAPALALLSRQGPIRVDVFEGSDDELMPRLQRGDIEVFVGTVGVEGEVPNVVETLLSRVSFEVFVRASHPLGSYDRITIAELAAWDGQWALPAPGSAFRRQIESLFIGAGCQFPKNYISCHTLSFQKELVTQMDCVTMLPPSAAELEVISHRFTRITLETDRLSRGLGLKHLRHRRLSPLGRRFVDAAQEAAGIEPILPS